MNTNEIYDETIEGISNVLETGDIDKTKKIIDRLGSFNNFNKTLSIEALMIERSQSDYIAEQALITDLSKLTHRQSFNLSYQEAFDNLFSRVENLNKIDISVHATPSENKFLFLKDTLIESEMREWDYQNSQGTTPNQRKNKLNEVTKNTNQLVSNISTLTGNELKDGLEKLLQTIYDENEELKPSLSNSRFSKVIDESFQYQKTIYNDLVEKHTKNIKSEMKYTLSLDEDNDKIFSQVSAEASKELADIKAKAETMAKADILQVTDFSKQVDTEHSASFFKKSILDARNSLGFHINEEKIRFLYDHLNDPKNNPNEVIDKIGLDIGIATVDDEDKKKIQDFLIVAKNVSDKVKDSFEEKISQESSVLSVGDSKIHTLDEETINEMYKQFTENKNNIDEDITRIKEKFDNETHTHQVDNFEQKDTNTYRLGSNAWLHTPVTALMIALAHSKRNAQLNAIDDKKLFSFTAPEAFSGTPNKELKSFLNGELQDYNNPNSGTYNLNLEQQVKAKADKIILEQQDKNNTVLSNFEKDRIYKREMENAIESSGANNYEIKNFVTARYNLNNIRSDIIEVKNLQKSLDQKKIELDNVSINHPDRDRIAREFSMEQDKVNLKIKQINEDLDNHNKKFKKFNDKFGDLEFSNKEQLMEVLELPKNSQGELDRDLAQKKYPKELAKYDYFSENSIHNSLSQVIDQNVDNSKDPSFIEKYREGRKDFSNPNKDTDNMISEVGKEAEEAKKKLQEAMKAILEKITGLFNRGNDGPSK